MSVPNPLINRQQFPTTPTMQSPLFRPQVGATGFEAAQPPAQQKDDTLDQMVKMLELRSMITKARAAKDASKLAGAGAGGIGGGVSSSAAGTSAIPGI